MDSFHLFKPCWVVPTGQGKNTSESFGCRLNIPGTRTIDESGQWAILRSHFPYCKGGSVQDE